MFIKVPHRPSLHSTEEKSMTHKQESFIIDTGLFWDFTVLKALGAAVRVDTFSG